ncbi:MAG: hypothetical protein R3B95_16310 [Nitrospirales bacterium]|nr:hypothetical protein [Nitrospirales bacterium]
MEAAGGVGMVSSKLIQNSLPLKPDNALSTTVLLSEVLNSGIRLEAAAFNADARQAVEALRESGMEVVPLYGEGGIAEDATNAFRFRRVYVDKTRGIPFLSSSDIIDLRPVPEHFLSRKLTRNVTELTICQHDVLISCSGTIGNVALAGRRIAGMALSQHAIRVRFNDPDLAGFVTGFLRSKYGRVQLTQSAYGSVVSHIEPDHLKRVLIPNFHPVKLIEIGRQFIEACKARDEAIDLLDEADRFLHKSLNLPFLSTLARGRKRSLTSKVRTSKLDGRLDASYHDALAEAAEKRLARLPCGVLRLNDPSLSKEIRAVTKFRKRIYVPGDGIPLLTSKQLFQVAPIDMKRLGRRRHQKDMKEIALEENMIAVTCSGTVGKVQIIPGYMAGWAASQDSLRIVPSSPSEAGFLYAWLNGEYGQRLVKRHTYGSVVVHIDLPMLKSVPVPNANESVRKQVGELVLRGNELRNNAWILEQKAIRQIESLLSKR